MPRIDNTLSPLVPKLEGFHLFHFDGAPCAQRVRFAIAEKGLRRGREVKFDADDLKSCESEEGAWTSRIVSLIKKDHMSDFYARIQPNLVVPALVHDGVLYTESMDIVAYIDETFGGEPLVPKHNEPLMAEVQQLTELGKSLHRSIRFVTFRWGLGRLGMLNKKEEEQLKALVKQGNDQEQLVDFYVGYDRKAISDDVYQTHLDALAAGFTLLEKRLGEGRSFVAGNTLTMADVIWAMKVLRLDECGYPFSKCYPAVYEWFQRIEKRPAFQTGVMAKNRGFNRAFRFKSRVENMFGIGLEKAVMGGLA